MKIYQNVVFTLLLITSSLSPIFSQESDKNIIAGKQFKVFSKTLNEDRPILISLPYGYGQSQKRYPVIYITDGSEYRLQASGGLIKYLSNNKIPEMICVFIPNTNRGRDLSYYPMDQLPGSGSGRNFARFINEELIPYIDKNYRTTSYRTLVGYSAGGEFVLYTMFDYPETFNAIIAASPSIFSDKEFLEKTNKFFKEHKELDKFLYVTYYSKESTVTSKIWPKVDKIIKTNLPAKFRYKTKIFDGSDHVPPTALHDGLIELFKDWKRPADPEILPSGGFINNNIPVIVTLDSPEKQIHYTLDGSEPTMESALYTGSIEIKTACTLKAKVFQGNLCESSVATAEFKNAIFNPSEVKSEELKQGIAYEYFERRWYMLPDTINLVPVLSGISKKISISHRKKDEGFLFQFEGFINIVKSGSYRFYFFSAAEGKLFIDNQMLTEISPSRRQEEKSCDVFLEKGYYPIKILYTNPWNPDNNFMISYEGPGITKQEIPSDKLFYKNEN